MLDLQACDREPIHIPGAIQPHGTLLALTEPDLEIVVSAANTMAVLGVEARSNAGVHIGDLLGKKLASDLRRALELLPQDTANKNPQVLCRLERNSASYEVIGHRSEGLLVLEFEPAGGAGPQVDFPSRLADFLAGLGASNTPEQTCAIAARQVRQLSGFDRTLVYRFNDEWHGQVLAEDRNEKLPSYLGYWFPASDIPAQARELYRLNRSRIIPDAGYTPVPLGVAINRLTGRPLDLSLSTLRSVSPVHVQYMRNMGTAASMSFSILQEDRLWGLISCHNAAPRHIPFSLRRACELAAQVLALQLSASERQGAIEQRVRLRGHISALLASMSATDDFVDGLAAREADLLAVADAAGAAVMSRGVCRLVGRTPSEAQVRAIGAWVTSTRGGSQVVAIRDLPAHFPEAEQCRHVASGLLAVSVTSSFDRYIMWFRPERAERVTWAGDPHKPALSENSERLMPDRLNPRKSFDSWTQEVRGTAVPWSEAQIAAVSELRADAAGIVLRHAEALAALSAELQRTNRELESFSYSVSHDLRAPFRHIAGYAQLLRDTESDRLSERGRRYANIVIDAARDAGRLIDNLLSFSQMGRTSLRPTPLELDLLFSEVQAEVMAAEGAGRKITWEISPLPRVVADLAMLRLALRNLLSNAVKYTRDRGVAAHIRVSALQGEQEVGMEVRDNGVGFDMKYASKLFGVFQRLHRMEEFEGTGIGLANVRRIVERHGGRVWAEGRPGEGATFGFALPRAEIVERS